VPKQVTVRLHVPWHAPRAFAGVRNCLAEMTVVQQTTIAVMANNIFFTIGFAPPGRKTDANFRVYWTICSNM
jgi:hypothetical protein